MGFEFYWPWMAVLLVVPLLVRLLWPRSDPDQADTLAGRRKKTKISENPEVKRAARKKKKIFSCTTCQTKAACLSSTAIFRAVRSIAPFEWVKEKL